MGNYPPLYLDLPILFQNFRSCMKWNQILSFTFRLKEMTKNKLDSRKQPCFQWNWKKFGSLKINSNYSVSCRSCSKEWCLHHFPERTALWPFSSSHFNSIYCGLGNITKVKWILQFFQKLIRCQIWVTFTFNVFLRNVILCVSK